MLYILLISSGSMFCNECLYYLAVYVVVYLESNQHILQLGIFSGGLSSFMSSSDTENEIEEEIATAGMELSVLGTHLRPFTFFSGQGELMSHVWSGTASERTTAYQVIFLFQVYIGHICILECSYTAYFKIRDLPFTYYTSTLYIYWLELITWYYDFWPLKSGRFQLYWN